MRAIHVKSVDRNATQDSSRLLCTLLVPPRKGRRYVPVLFVPALGASAYRGDDILPHAINRFFLCSSVWVYLWLIPLPVDFRGGFVLLLPYFVVKRNRIPPKR